MSSTNVSYQSYTSWHGVDFIIKESQEIDITELDTDSSMNTSHTPPVSGWSVDSESDYTRSPFAVSHGCQFNPC